MPLLLSAHDLGQAFGARPLFSGVSFTLADGDRVGLIGPNGAGKSTLLAILAGALTPDDGNVALRAGARVAYVPQAFDHAPDATVREVVLGALPRDQTDQPSRLEELLSRLQLASARVSPDSRVGELSGGLQRRVALARALIVEPDLLLLDEPTNHLDLESIEWLERLLTQAPFASVTVTHDRSFLQGVARRILELDRKNRGGLLEVDGDYATYVERKAEQLSAQEQREQSLRNRLRRETEWLRRGPKARSTKQTARIERAGELAREVQELSTRNATRKAEIDLQGSGRRTQRLIEAHALSKSYGAHEVFTDVDLLLARGSRIALIGDNGAGKSTLLRVLLGQEPPSAGRVERAEQLVVQLFDQHREALDPERTVADSVAEGDFVDYGGSRLHRHGYLERFLFRPEQMRMRVGALSGGERSRLLIARLMLRPADVLVLDEPTNDLDFDTLDVLQDALLSFDGAVLLVSHDRYFVDQIATQIVAFHAAPGEPCRVQSFADLHQWQSFRASQTKEPPRAHDPRRAEPEPTGSAPPASGKRKRLSYKDQRDYETLEARIEAAEAALAAREAECNDPAVSRDGLRLRELSEQIAELRTQIDALYTRWAELEAQLQT